MKHSAVPIVIAALAVALPSARAQKTPSGKGAAMPSKYIVQSTDFKDGEPLPKSATCDGEGTPPALSWRADHLVQAKSFALIADDPDAPRGTFTHWVLFNIPGVAEGLPKGTSGVGVSGRNDFGKIGYGAACPPKGHGTHRYYFRVYALNVEKLGLAEGASRSEVESAMASHVVGQGELMGKYVRR